ncbi:hypothetical protein KI387_002782, partial [Taxus chinensis]
RWGEAQWNTHFSSKFSTSNDYLLLGELGRAQGQHTGRGLPSNFLKRLGSTASTLVPPLVGDHGSVQAQKDALPVEYVSVSLADKGGFSSQLLGSRAIFAKFVGCRLSTDGIRNWGDSQWGS